MKLVDVVRWTAHPALVTAGLVLAHALAGSVPHFVSVLVPISLAALLVFALERWLPFRVDWAPRVRDLPQDLAHNLLSTVAVSALARAVALGSLVHLGVALERAMGSSLWPHRWPLIAQFVLALVVKELPYYVTHRLLHATRFGWRLHTLHHASPALYAMASGRTHPLNVLLTYGLPLVPLILLGAPEAMFTWSSVFMGIHGLLQHANVGLRYGGLNLIFATADVHRHHHARDPVVSASNFGHNVLVWDHLFGSFRWPARASTLAVGVADEPQPAAFWRQLTQPFSTRGP